MEHSRDALKQVVGLTEKRKKYRKGDFSNTVNQTENAVMLDAFKDRMNMIDQTLFELPFAHPRDMNLLYQKYGLNQKGFAPFFKPSVLEQM
jgi:hypothetical protein